jgi:radical SAM superfamily enzyme YgiQ (UPF0313 family)
MHDLAIFSVPYFETTAPGAGPALIKGYLTTQGFSVVARDWNLEFKERINNSEIYGELISYWSKTNQTDIQKSTMDIYHALLKEFAQEFVNLKARWLGFGVFSYASQQCLYDLLVYLRQQDIGSTRIVIGGHGLDNLYIDNVCNLVDVWIKGEGEIALRELLKENFSYPGIMSNPVQIEDLDQLGFADYSDYNLASSHYNLWYDEPMIQITGSRGCVRSCSFCDVPSIWKKYRYRSGQSIADEIITNHEKTGIKHFYFTDSLINGNLKTLMDMMRVLKDYKNQTGSELTWGGQWIVRSQKGLPKDYYKLIKSSGGFNLTIGVETGSDAVRAHMKKGFTNKDLDEEMTQFSNHSITCGFFMILGYPTETEEDFKDSLRMFKRYVKYVADGTIVGVAIGYGYVPMEKTPLVLEGNSLKFIGDNKLKWISTTTNSNWIENVRRRLIAQKVLINLKWPANNVEYELKPILKNSKLLFDEENKQLIQDLLVDKNIEPDPEFLEDTKPHEFEVSLTLHGNCGEEYPKVKIEINDQVVNELEIVGTQTLIFQVNNLRRRNTIKITMTNKHHGDVLVENGQIVRDKSVKFDNFTIHGSKFDREFLIINGRVKTKEGIRERYRDGLYGQYDTYTLYFENPVHPYFIQRHKFYFEHRNKFAKDMLDKITHLFENFVN